MNGTSTLGWCMLAQVGDALDNPIVQGSVALAAIAIVAREASNLVRWAWQRRNGVREQSPGYGQRCIKHGEQLARMEAEVKLLLKELEK